LPAVPRPTPVARVTTTSLLIAYCCGCEASSGLDHFRLLSPEQSALPSADRDTSDSAETTADWRRGWHDPEVNGREIALQQIPLIDDEDRRPAFVSELPRASGELTWTIRGTYLYGQADGFVQVPSGGNQGTTSHDRPTLSEIGIDDASIYDAVATGSQGPHEVFVGGQWLRMSGSDTLNEDLTSQAQDFSAGSSVQSDLRLDWYRAGYRYRFSWHDRADPNRTVLSLAPSIGIDVLDFDFKLHGPGGTDVSRSYVKGGGQVGLEARFWLSDRWSIVAEGMASMPIPDTPFIVTGQLVGRYEVFDTPGYGLAAFAGVAYEHIGYHDNQDESNHINIDLGPLLVLGLELRL
jgi:hypothetical protein